MKKNQSGITLIALVITIIVLLILAGVSIAMLLGQNGILGHATDAKADTEEAEIADKINMALNGEYSNLIIDGKLSGTGTDADIQAANGLDSTYTVTPAADLKADGSALVITKKTKSGKDVTGTIKCASGKYTIEKAKYPGE